MKTQTTLKPQDRDETQARLDALPGSEGNIFDNNIWTFQDSTDSDIHIDFTDLPSIAERHPDWPLANSVDWILLTKRMWLSLHSEARFANHKNKINGLKLLWEAMASLNITQIKIENCTAILEFFLTHAWSNGRLREIPSIKSHGSFKETTRLDLFQSALVGQGLDWISRSFTESTLKKNLKLLIPSLTDEELTYRDWTEGGSYDYLTFDIGRYYIEHCMEFFDKTYSLAIALKSTTRAVQEIAETIGQSTDTTNKIITKTLHGHSPEEIKKMHPSHSITKIKRVHDMASQHFLSAYKQADLEAQLLKDESLKQFSISCNLQPNDENIDRLRVIHWDWIQQKNKRETKKLLAECQKKISWNTFQKHLTTIENECSEKTYRIPSVQDYKSLGLITGEPFGSGNSFHRQLTRLTAQSGLTIEVALTGWRRSEMGFPYSAIIRTRNKDKLDQYAFPWRYEVDWYVKKTHGQVRQKREVTSSIIILAKKLQLLHGATDDDPCLYGVKGIRKNQFDSTDTVKRYVPALWEHFVNHYSQFKQLDDLAIWHSLQKKLDTGKKLKAKEQLELKRLNEKKSDEEWDNLNISIDLKEAYHRTRSELSRVKFGLIRQTSKKDGHQWLVKYRNGTLKKEWQELLDNHLSTDIKQWLHSMPDSELNFPLASKLVTQNLLDGTVYPTPHAFRHMWAEAVYRRFDGDVGWMIRSQFKHITRTMWQRYVRDKDNRHNHQVVKTNVTSSLVQNYLKHKGSGYAGNLHKWLRRIFNSTLIASPEEQVQLADHIATVEIESIRALPWGYCLLKRRTRSKAKCAEMGGPMPHNALAELCLGCPHNLMQTGNVEWSLFNAATHVEALQNPNTLSNFKAASYDHVKNVTKHVFTLNPEHEAIPQLKETLKNYRTSRAA